MWGEAQAKPTVGDPQQQCLSHTSTGWAVSATHRGVIRLGEVWQVRTGRLRCLVAMQPNLIPAFDRGWPRGFIMGA